MGDINQDIVSTPAVVSQDSPKDDSSFGGVSKQQTKKERRSVRMVKVSRAQQCSVETSEKMESLEPEDAVILLRLKEDLKEMRRSNSRSSQK